MTLTLETQGTLLQTHFPLVRKRLVGAKRRSKYSLTRVLRLCAQFLLISIIVATVLIIGSIVIPEVWSRLTTDTQQDEVFALAPESVAAEPAPSATPVPAPVRVQDRSLPIETRIRIPLIGVDTQAQALTNSDEALEQGAWMVPDFGRPGDTTQPTIIAAHRYGWKWWWKTDFGKRNSFYSLTETHPGDTIEIIYEQKKYTYEIYAEDEGSQITDYSANLILYTCKYLNSPIRYFRYARLID